MTSNEKIAPVQAMKIIPEDYKYPLALATVQN
jgi:hypothetical protein